MLPGTHKLSAIPYSNLTNLAGDEYSINFDIVDTNGKGILRVGYFTYQLIDSSDNSVITQLRKNESFNAPSRV